MIGSRRILRTGLTPILLSAKFVEVICRSTIGPCVAWVKVEHRIALKRTNQTVLGLLTALDGLPAELQQRPYAAMNLLVGGEQLTEITHLVQPLLVVLHACLDQQSRDRFFICTICFTSRCR